MGAGLAYVPQESNIFRSLTVAENLMLATEFMPRGGKKSPSDLPELMGLRGRPGPPGLPARMGPPALPERRGRWGRPALSERLGLRALTVLRG